MTLQHQTSWGLCASVEGILGMDYVLAEYDGTYSARNAVVTDGNISQSLVREEDRGPYNGSAKLATSKDFGPVILSIFGRGEIISAVPVIQYNDDEDSSDSSYSVNEIINGTQINFDRAISVSAGGGVTIPIGPGRRGQSDPE